MAMAAHVDVAAASSFKLFQLTVYINLLFFSGFIDETSLNDV